jgi:hypothetical protein
MVRLLAALWLVGIWHAAASLGAPTPLAAALTVAAALAGTWALLALRGR